MDTCSMHMGIGKHLTLHSKGSQLLWGKRVKAVDMGRVDVWWHGPILSTVNKASEVGVGRGELLDVHIMVWCQHGPF